MFMFMFMFNRQAKWKLKMEDSMDMLIIMRDSYEAVMEEKWKKLPNEFENKMKLKFPITHNKDTALHLAVHSGEEEPTRTFLAVAAELEIEQDFWKNNAGNTPLHEAATVGNLAAVKLLVEFRKEDMLEKNIYGETPLYIAAKYGQLEIVEYFVDECEDFFSRSPIHWIAVANDTPIIHVALQSENFEVVLKLVDFDKSLLEMKNSKDHTALHVLANMPHVFESGLSMQFWERFIYNLVPRDNIYKFNFSNFGSLDNNNDSKSSSTKNEKNEDLEGRSNCWLYLQGLKCWFWRCILIGWPRWKEVYEKKQRHELAVTIAEKLANIDYSWSQGRQNPENTQGVPIYAYEKLEDQKAEDKEIKYKDYHETPLLLAAARGIIEIVKVIVKVHPQAIDYVTVLDRNILHVVIAHRRWDIFKWIRTRKMVMVRLAKRIDNLGFTVLHHVGITKFICQASNGPALQLQQELKWFENVLHVVPPVYTMYHNNKQWKPREYFDETHQQMLESAKEWLKKTSESCSAVAVLIATVVFAAAFTVPGGLNAKTGSPVLLDDPIYLVFTIMDIAALTFSLASVVMFLSILTSPFNMDDFRHILPIKLSLGFQFLFFSVANTMAAFALAVLLTMKSTNLKWAESFLYLATFFPVTIFIIIQLPLYQDLVKNIWEYRKIILEFLPMGFVNLFSKAPKSLCRKSA